MSFPAFDTFMHRMSAFTLIVLATASVNPSQAQISRVQVYPLATQTLTTAELLTGKTEGKPETIACELRIPRPGNDRLPAVILMHSVRRSGPSNVPGPKFRFANAGGGFQKLERELATRC